MLDNKVGAETHEVMMDLQIAHMTLGLDQKSTYTERQITTAYQDLVKTHSTDNEQLVSLNKAKAYLIQHVIDPENKGTGLVESTVIGATPTEIKG